jgi:hypothetical protein
MAGTVTTTEEVYGPVNKITFDWLSDASGDATATTTGGHNGELIRAVFVPDTSTTAPSDQYDVTLSDGQSVDLLAGQGVNLSNVNTVVVVDDLIPLAGNKLTLTVANAGNAKGGVVYLYYRE